MLFMSKSKIENSIRERVKNIQDGLFRTQFGSDEGFHSVTQVVVKDCEIVTYLTYKYDANGVKIDTVTATNTSILETLING